MTLKRIVARDGNAKGQGEDYRKDGGKETKEKDDALLPGGTEALHIDSIVEKHCMAFMRSHGRVRWDGQWRGRPSGFLELTFLT